MLLLHSDSFSRELLLIFNVLTFFSCDFTLLTTTDSSDVIKRAQTRKFNELERTLKIIRDDARQMTIELK